MATAFHLELVTPERILFSGETDEVALRSDGGEIAFLAHHEDFVGAVDITVVRVHAPSASQVAKNGSSQVSSEDEARFAVHGGFVEVHDDKVTILAGVAEPSAEIDVERAQRALLGAEQQLADHGPTGSTPEAQNGDGQVTVAEMSGAMVGLLVPESAEAAARRARARLDAAGALTTT